MPKYFEHLIIVILICMSLGGFILSFMNNAKEDEITAVVDQFYRDLAVGDYDKAGELSVGKVKDLISKKNMDTGFTTNHLDTIVLYRSNKWARTYSEVEVVNKKTDCLNIEFWETQLISVSGEWKVLNTIPTSPRIREANKRIKQNTLDDIQGVFKTYLEKASKDPTSIYTAARQGIAFKNLTIDPLYANSYCVIAECRYQYDDKRDIDLVVTFWQTSDGWIVIDICSRAFPSEK